jgi:nucleotide-binding universal stress UspA family protein
MRGLRAVHIFFATDGSVSARFAQAQILALPWRSPVRITVMTATYDPPPAFRSLIPAAHREIDAAPVDVIRGSRPTATEVVDKARCAMEKQGVSVATRIHEGLPGPTIVEMARACRVDLVAVGSRGLGEYKGFLLGSVSDYVVHNAHCSVLLAKSPPKTERRFLLAVNDSPHAEAVLQWMKELDLASGAWIHQVMVFRSLDDSFLRMDDMGRRRIARTIPPARLVSCSSPPPPDMPATSSGQELFPPAVRLTASVRCGQEVPEILATIRDFMPELLVLGAGARRGPDGLLLGDITRKLIHQAPCSILVVRP